MSVDKAIDYLEDAEREPNLGLKLSKLEHGFQILDDCLAQEIGSSERERIENIRFAHTRQFLVSLPEGVGA